MGELPRRDGLLSVADQMYVDGEGEFRYVPYSAGTVGISGVLSPFRPPCVHIEFVRDITKGVVMTFHQP